MSKVIYYLSRFHSRDWAYKDILQLQSIQLEHLHCPAGVLGLDALQVTYKCPMSQRLCDLMRSMSVTKTWHVSKFKWVYQYRRGRSIGESENCEWKLNLQAETVPVKIK